MYFIYWYTYVAFDCIILAEDSAAVKANTIPAIRMPQLPPEPTGRCSNKLQVFGFQQSVHIII